MERQTKERYQRQLVLPGHGPAGQQKLAQARVAIVGMGGLGSPVSLYLAAAGVGSLVLIDGDSVDVSNLQRQILFKTNDQGALKTRLAALRLQELNPEVQIETMDHALGDKQLSEELPPCLQNCTLWIDATDSFASKLLLNQMAFKKKFPLLFGAVTAFEGRISFLDGRNSAGPCLACLYPQSAQTAAQAQASPSDQGILGAMAGWVGSAMALEAIQFLVQGTSHLERQLLVMEGRSLSTKVFAFGRKENCSICGR